MFEDFVYERGLPGSVCQAMVHAALETAHELPESCFASLPSQHSPAMCGASNPVVAAPSPATPVAGQPVEIFHEQETGMVFACPQGDYQWMPWMTSLLVLFVERQSAGQSPRHFLAQRRSVPRWNAVWSLVALPSGPHDSCPAMPPLSKLVLLQSDWLQTPAARRALHALCNPNSSQQRWPT
mmetsp:Transcript_58087/g.155251  ORF Transcript_58087/g.155251 Transcript_58087/m.155251 type:complete len:182 (+) Transcript_58087:890-1435(+)